MNVGDLSMVPGGMPSSHALYLAPISGQNGQCQSVVLGTLLIVAQLGVLGGCVSCSVADGREGREARLLAG